MTHWLRRVSAGMLSGAIFLSVAEVVAQTPVVSLRPFAAVANLPLARRQVPLEPGGFTEAHFDGTTILGLEVSVGRATSPIALRLGWAQTVGADIRMRDDAVTESCGTSCSRTTVGYSPIGDASVSHGTIDVVVSPFSWRVSPHAFLGVVYRRVRYSPTLSAAAPLFINESELARLYGFGVDIRVTERTAVRIGAARQLSGMWLKGDADTTPWGDVAVLSLGAQVDLVGTARR